MTVDDLTPNDFPAEELAQFGSVEVLDLELLRGHPPFSFLSSLAEYGRDDLLAHAFNKNGPVDVETRVLIARRAAKVGASLSSPCYDLNSSQLSDM